MVMKSNLLYLAMLLMILCIPFWGNENEVRWLWEDFLWVPLTFLLVSLMCLALYVYRKENHT
jgi:hypothetical protein